ncbi:BMP-binding endothelial regulator protein-like [Pomacea canaliculata]|uniref:BMP-binding endothelial regulator protein-like n=1 Tax=Pomacea canaliculata TaxID=400727 RepID=UPI000D729853|nr:BMP-binding endothelial regulator protein-like [Pomacea canaliculata]
MTAAPVKQPTGDTTHERLEELSLLNHYGLQTQWTGLQQRRQLDDSKDPCKRLHCRAGVVTEVREQCFTHCHTPLPVEGRCCPVCPGCRFRGEDYAEGERFTLSHDVCSECVCQNGSISCTKRACAVLNCPASVIFQPKGECCPKCRGMRRIFDVPSRCYFAKQVYRRGQVFHPDTCSSCRCMSGTSLCTRVSCPVMDCPPEERTKSEDGCCDTCPTRRLCTFQGAQHSHKEEWQPSPCLKCACDNGVTYCQRERCSNSLWCPKGYQLRLERTLVVRSVWSATPCVQCSATLTTKPSTGGCTTFKEAASTCWSTTSSTTPSPSKSATAFASPRASRGRRCWPSWWADCASASCRTCGSRSITGE